jgi:hypothetical protein
MAPAAPDGGAESQRQADLLKQEGNAFFRKERLSAAIDAYTGVSLTDWLPAPGGRILRLIRVLRACRSKYQLSRRPFCSPVQSMSAAARLVRPADKFSESMLNSRRLLPEC